MFAGGICHWGNWMRGNFFLITCLPQNQHFLWWSHLVKDRDTLIEQSVANWNKRGTQNNSQTSSLWQIYEANKDIET